MAGSGSTAFLDSLEQSQWLPSDRLVAYQRRLLDRLVRHARGETDFYAERLSVLFRPDDTIDWERWPELPILGRDEARANLAALVARSSAAAGPAAERTTTGSTGKPFRHFTSEIQTAAATSANERFYRWHGLDPHALTAFIRVVPDGIAGYPDGLLTPGWRPYQPDSRGVVLSIGGASIDQQIEWLQRVRPAHLVSYPTDIREIARVAAARGIRLDLSAVLTFAEASSPEMRAEIRDYFGCEPLDRYGAMEVALIAATCPHSHRHHVMAELVLVEIVDDAGCPVEPGTGAGLSSPRSTTTPCR